MRFLEQLFWRRPRILNQLHRVGLARATSQTNEQELATLARYATGAKTALEIGTHQGVSAARIASALDAEGTLFCVDPWPEVKGRPDPCWQICERHLRRTQTQERIKIIRGFSGDVQHLLPENIDFAFIDGDHSWDGIQTDWNIVSSRIVGGGLICLHDTVVPQAEPWRQFDSVKFFQDAIAKNSAFETVEVVYSMTILRKVQPERGCLPY